MGDDDRGEPWSLARPPRFTGNESPAERFHALSEQHLYAARVSRQLSDDDFLALMSAANECVVDEDLDVEVVLFRPMANVMTTMLMSASGGHGSFNVPDSAGYLLDALFMYAWIQDNARLPRTNRDSEVSTEFRRRMAES